MYPDDTFDVEKSTNEIFESTVTLSSAKIVSLLVSFIE